MFQVFTIVPTYDFRDAITGSRAIAHPYNFLTVEGARAAARLRDRDADDTYSVVVRLGESPYSQAIQPPRGKGFDYDAAMDDMPF